jgi:hypothetical protein
MRILECEKNALGTSTVSFTRAGSQALRGSFPVGLAVAAEPACRSAPLHNVISVLVFDSVGWKHAEKNRPVPMIKVTNVFGLASASLTRLSMRWYDDVVSALSFCGRFSVMMLMLPSTAKMIEL